MKQIDDDYYSSKIYWNAALIDFLCTINNVMSVIIAQSSKNSNAFSNIFAEETLENFFVSALYWYFIVFTFLKARNLLVNFHLHNRVE